MSISPTKAQTPTAPESIRSVPYFPAMQSSKDRLLEQKRAEHEQTRQEHRRRFEEQMHLLESKQQRDEAILTGVEEESSIRSLRTLPVTPVKTPSQSDARSRASTTSKTSPTLKVFEPSRHSANDQLVTPPTDSQNKSTTTFGPVRSVPGSRRTSSLLDLENLALGETPDSRRTTYIEQTRTPSQIEPHRLSLPKIYSTEEVPATSYLQMNTTDDSFPILVRRDSYAPNMTPSLPSADHPQDFRKTPYSTMTLPNFIALSRTAASGPQACRGSLDDSDAVRARPLPELSLPSGQKSAIGSSQILHPNDQARRSFTAIPDNRPALESPPNMPSLNNPSMHGPNQFNPYGLVQPHLYGQNYAGFPAFAPHQHDGQRNSNPYVVMNRPSNYHRRSEDANRYADVALETLVGDIYSLCKDQHGCRYLQKKLDERNPTLVDMIFEETYTHAAELMIDPFGNYLCQKLLEHCDDQKRLKIVQTVAPDLINISLNMHGTRAVQKLVESLTTPEQIQIATSALNINAVTLIKDLNGNHVVQKCLNRLGSVDNQFIFDAVSKHCVEVATHRHGCCVMQRCIDHASEAQKIQVIAEINNNAPLLVQDPFGNYVVQYVLDLGDARFSNSLIRRFIGNVCAFSIQKFSSNVIEKCLRVSEPPTRALLISELLHKVRLEKLLRDSYANYVIQTALDYAEVGQRQQLIECIRPLLPAIRTTPYGRRIQSKINGNTPTTGLAGNFNYVPQVSSFPGYSFTMPQASGPIQSHEGSGPYVHSFKNNYDY